MTGWQASMLQFFCVSRYTLAAYEIRPLIRHVRHFRLRSSHARTRSAAREAAARARRRIRSRRRVPPEGAGHVWLACGCCDRISLLRLFSAAGVPWGILLLSPESRRGPDGQAFSRSRQRRSRRRAGAADFLRAGAAGPAWRNRRLERFPGCRVRRDQGPSIRGGGRSRRPAPGALAPVDSYRAPESDRAHGLLHLRDFLHAEPAQLEIPAARFYTFSRVRCLEAVARPPTGKTPRRLGHHGGRLD